jgi:ssRNA-specific RNase YbeY (16S rRNA maturation enzyme)
LYLLHGLLHLAGFDDVEPSQRKRMLHSQKQFWATLRRTSP